MPFSSVSFLKSNLLSISSSIFFISDIVVSISRSLVWVFFVSSSFCLSFEDMEYSYNNYVSLSANSSICVSFSWLIILFSMRCLFLPSCIPDSLWLGAWHVKFTLLDARSFGLPLSLLELCLGMQLSYLEAVWSFQVFYDVLSGFVAMVSLG